ncbi:hypothetical protein O6H91_02G148600 [Diphasiastrum complanatum]|uniref:Uncharacterized protein n=1 Tax=Diphasiastrum complanatum TaxID=34168 RepID=A0ACC2EM27_DIPCM|nr:hypothetical protein O6H91_02G148600 [Diphasiastrum complanatum]
MGKGGKIAFWVLGASIAPVSADLGLHRYCPNLFGPPSHLSQPIGASIAAVPGFCASIAAVPRFCGSIAAAFQLLIFGLNRFLQPIASGIATFSADFKGKMGVFSEGPPTPVQRYCSDGQRTVV